MAYVDFISRVHKSTKRDYLERVCVHDKAECAEVAVKFGREYWDGDRKYGYGGYHYDGRWRVVLFADDAAIDFVRILLFKDFAQLADEKQLQTRSLPPVTTEDPQTSILSAPAPIARPPVASATKPPATTSPGATATPKPQQCPGAAPGDPRRQEADRGTQLPG